MRKLEFLIADALEKGHDSVITIGGAQSNHARATAVAARQLGLEAHLILRGPAEQTAGSLCGNLLFDRLVGAQLYVHMSMDVHMRHCSHFTPYTLHRTLTLTPPPCNCTLALPPTPKQIPC